jgi:hypothetical protein
MTHTGSPIAFRKIAALEFLISRPYSFRTLGGNADVHFLKQISLAFVLAALCLAGNGHAQAVPVTYWIPSWPVGFAGNVAVGQSSNTYGNFPSFDGSDARGGAVPICATIFERLVVGSEGGGMV